MWCNSFESDKPVVCGIVSFGNGCARQGYPGVYQRVAADMDAINAAYPTVVGGSESGGYKLKWVDPCSVSSNSSSSGGGNTTSSSSSSLPMVSTSANTSSTTNDSTSHNNRNNTHWWAQDSTSATATGGGDYNQTTNPITTPVSAQPKPKPQDQLSSSSSSTSHQKEQNGNTSNGANYILDPCTGLMVAPADVCPNPPPAASPTTSSSFNINKDAAATIPTTATTTTTNSNIISQDHCLSFYIQQKQNSTSSCKDSRFKGRRGNERTISWIIEQKDHRCSPCMFRYCAPLTCGVCGESVEEATTASAQCSQG